MTSVAIAIWGLIGVLLLIGRQNPFNHPGLRQGADLFLRSLPVFLGACFVAGILRYLIPERVITEWLGPQSGWKGLLIGYLAGTVTFGGPFVSFPVAASLIQAGANVGTVMTYVTTWGLWGGGIILYEPGVMGTKFFAFRLLISVLFPLFTGVSANLLLSKS